MKNFSKKLNKELANTQLTSSEKASIRARVLAYMEAHPATLVPSGVERSSYFFSSLQFISVSRYAFASLLVILLVGGSTVSAAQGALPGDTLYPIKISVNERVELALATTPEAKLQTEVRFAERRVTEAQALDAEGRLDADITKEIEKEFDKHVLNALALAERVSLAGEEQEEVSSRPEEEVAQTMALKVVEVEDTTVSALMGTATATPATSTTQTWSRGGVFFESLKAKKETLKGLRERFERQQSGVRDENKGDSGDDDKDEDKNSDDRDEDKSGKENDDRNILPVTLPVL